VAKSFLLLRITCCIFILQLLAEAIGPKITTDVLLPKILPMHQDAVANVRFNVAKTLQKLGPTFEQR
jgi:serine/threonine-protein phosphatase 2A regulatory subunit A